MFKSFRQQITPENNTNRPRSRQASYRIWNPPPDDSDSEENGPLAESMSSRPHASGRVPFVDNTARPQDNGKKPVYAQPVDKEKSGKWAFLSFRKKTDPLKDSSHPGASKLKINPPPKSVGHQAPASKPPDTSVPLGHPPTPLLSRSLHNPQAYLTAHTQVPPKSSAKGRDHHADVRSSPQSLVASRVDKQNKSLRQVATHNIPSTPASDYSSQHLSSHTLATVAASGRRRETNDAPAEFSLQSSSHKLQSPSTTRNPTTRTLGQNEKWQTVTTRDPNYGESVKRVETPVLPSTSPVASLTPHVPNRYTHIAEAKPPNALKNKAIGGLISSLTKGGKIIVKRDSTSSQSTSRSNSDPLAKLTDETHSKQDHAAMNIPSNMGLEINPTRKFLEPLPRPSKMPAERPNTLNVNRGQIIPIKEDNNSNKDIHVEDVTIGRDEHKLTKLTPVPVQVINSPGYTSRHQWSNSIAPNLSNRTADQSIYSSRPETPGSDVILLNSTLSVIPRTTTPNTSSMVPYKEAPVSRHDRELSHPLATPQQIMPVSSTPSLGPRTDQECFTRHSNTNHASDHLGPSFIPNPHSTSVQGNASHFDSDGEVEIVTVPTAVITLPASQPPSERKGLAAQTMTPLLKSALSQPENTNQAEKIIYPHMALIPSMISEPTSRLQVEPIVRELALSSHPAASHQTLTSQMSRDETWLKPVTALSPTSPSHSSKGKFPTGAVREISNGSISSTSAKLSHTQHKEFSKQPPIRSKTDMLPSSSMMNTLQRGPSVKDSSLLSALQTGSENPEFIHTRSSDGRTRTEPVVSSPSLSRSALPSPDSKYVTTGGSDYSRHGNKFRQSLHHSSETSIAKPTLTSEPRLTEVRIVPQSFDRPNLVSPRIGRSHSHQAAAVSPAMLSRSPSDLDLQSAVNEQLTVLSDFLQRTEDSGSKEYNIQSPPATLPAAQELRKSESRMSSRSTTPALPKLSEPTDDAALRRKQLVQSLVPERPSNAAPPTPVLPSYEEVVKTNPSSGRVLAKTTTRVVPPNATPQHSVPSTPMPRSLRKPQFVELFYSNGPPSTNQHNWPPPMPNQRPVEAGEIRSPQPQYLPEEEPLRFDIQFRLFSRRRRTVSHASLDALDGAETTGSASIRSPTPNSPQLASPPRRDPHLATSDWLDKEEEAHVLSERTRRHRPGVTFDVSDEEYSPNFWIRQMY